MRALFILFTLILSTACSHEVQVKAPEKPIVINLNVDHNIKVQMDKDVKKAISENKEIF